MVLLTYYCKFLNFHKKYGIIPNTFFFLILNLQNTRKHKNMCKNERKKVICTNCDATKAYCLIASKTSRKKIRLVNVYP